MGKQDTHFWISNFRRVQNVVCFLLGNSPASEVYMPTFRNTVCSIFTGRKAPVEWTRLEEFWCITGEGVWLENSLAIREVGDRVGAGRYPLQSVSVLNPPPTLSPTSLMARLFSSQMPSPVIHQNPSNPVHSTHAYLPLKMEQSVPKRRHINFIRRGITQRKQTRHPFVVWYCWGLL
jgi:hypothetical protein